MPLPRGKSEAARDRIIATEVREGKDQKQAVAIGYSVWRKRNGKKPKKKS